MKRACAVLGIGLALGCAGATGPPRSIAPGGLRGIDFEPDLTVRNEFPVQLSGVIEVTNRRRTPVVLTFPRGCAARLRVYEEQGSRVAPVWDQRGAGSCAPGPLTLDLAPGASSALELPAVNAHDILGDSLPAGEYRLTIYLEPDGQVIEVEAGRVDLAVSRSRESS